MSEDWREAAKTALEGLEQCTAADRAAYIDGRQSIWKELKQKLAGISHEKCWFCESKNVRADNAVDHFRPKNAVAGNAAHEGYWWLAFEWSNYRFTCTFCNSIRKDPNTGIAGGKGTHFPVLDELRRAMNGAGDCGNEQPLLLDPCCNLDPPHLWFEEDGTPKANPNVCGAAGSFPSQRVTASIQFYHLSHSILVDERKKVCQKAKLDALEAEKLMPRYDNGDMTARTSVECTVKSLQAMLNSQQEYSRAVRCTMMFLRSTSRVAEMALE